MSSPSNNSSGVGGSSRSAGPASASGGVEPTLVSSLSPQARPAGHEDAVIRYITFWRNGFSILDGPLLRYDQPQNVQLLKEINAGRAPVKLLDVRPGQPVELRVASRTDEDYVPPAPAEGTEI